MMNNKFARDVDNKLEDALAMQAAGIPLAEILAGAGDDADWLRPLLETATQVAELQTAITVPSPQASLQRMLAYGEELAATAAPVRTAQPGWLMGLTRLLGGGWLPRLAAGIGSALLVTVLLASTLTVLAQRSLPGQPLYSLKRAGERLQLGLTLDPTQRDLLLKNYNQRRQMEARLLLEQNQVATVVFMGQIDMVTETSLLLDSLVIQLTPQTKVSGQLANSAQVEVKVLTQPPDQLIALTVTVIEPAPPTPTPLPTSTPSPRPSATATPTATRSLSSATDTLKLPTATPLNPATQPPTFAPPPATATPPAPTPIPPGEGNGNDNTNENGNEDGGNNDNDNSNDDEHAGDNSNDNSNDDNSGSDNSGSGGGNSGSGGGGSGSSGSDQGPSDNSGSSNDGGGGDGNSGKGGGKND